ncbi:hypothetical protein WDU94_001502 [Cyamophila willieti]
MVIKITIIQLNLHQRNGTKFQVPIMVETNSRLLVDITKDENDIMTAKFHYENLKTSFYGFYTRNRDVLFVVLFLLLVIGLHLYRNSIIELFCYLRNKRYRVKNDLPNILKCKKCQYCLENDLQDPALQEQRCLFPYYNEGYNQLHMSRSPSYQRSLYDPPPQSPLTKRQSEISRYLPRQHLLPIMDDDTSQEMAVVN